MKLIELAQLSESRARQYLEAIRWPNGPVCPRCGESETVYKLKGKSHRPGLLKCGKCREPFSVTVGTVMESSHIPIVKWLLAFHFVVSSKKGMSAHQLHRMLNVTYKTAWFMHHRIRHALRDSPPIGRLGGTVEVDETYVGGRPRKGRKLDARTRDVNWFHPNKVPVVALVERDGRARAMALEKVKGRELKGLMAAYVDRTSRIMTDESPNYKGTAKLFASHETVNHSKDEYVRGDVSTNQVEAFFSLVKRQHYGTNHHYSKRHCDRYIQETVFRWNGRKVSDETRRDIAIAGIGGKRLTYSTTKSQK
ncbi:MAG: IS1595 family transposase [bacterium]